uniref:NAD-dependent epimerase/dehydratase domain-containing protein n=1 Tax=Leersia perrieri TaxID=77586 RepID=A0A0D9VMH7_9ORYZ
MEGMVNANMNFFCILGSRINQSTMLSNSISSSNGEKQQQLVCVTGAGGFIGSWVVKELLLRGNYRVRGTARDPGKNAHLLALEGAGERRLTLCRADVLDYGSLLAAFAGCHGVFHVASPISKDPNLVAVAVEGTRNVVNAAADMGVRRVVFTSSYGAVHMNPNRSPDAVVDETCWSDPEFCRQTDIYCYAKMMAEKMAEAEAAKRGVELSVVVPCVTVGPILQPAVNLSNQLIVRYLLGAAKTYPNAVAAYVDVRDVARTHVLVYECPDAHGRYLCVGTVIHRAQLLQMLKELFPYYAVTSKCEDEGNPMVQPYKFSNKRLKDLGLEFTPLRQSLHETIMSLKRKGQLPVVGAQQRARFCITMSSISNIAINNGDDLKQQQRQLVCVTGAGGFIGSWVVRELLLRGKYLVRAAVRDPARRKNAHLLKLDGAGERLSLCRADVLDLDGLLAAFAGCHGVFHVASPISKDPNLVAVAVEGTRNVVNAAADMGVRRVVFTSSYGAVHMNPNRNPDVVVDETCWSDLEFCRQTDVCLSSLCTNITFEFRALNKHTPSQIYCYAKMMAEKTAAAEASKRGLELSVVVPCVTVGPILQPDVNLSNQLTVRYLIGAVAAYPNAVAGYVDVRDVARAHILVYERPDALGRYLCIGAVIHRAQILRMLKELFPYYPYCITMSSNSKSNNNNGDANRQRQMVCVTGAGGFIGGTARNPTDRKNAHLLALDGASERLSLCRADLLDSGSLRAAFAGCNGVFHVACPVSKHDPNLVKVAVEETRNVMNAAADMRVRRLVFTCDDEVNLMVKPYRFSSQRIKALGLEFTPLRQSLKDEIVCLQHMGHLPLVAVTQQPSTMSSINTDNSSSSSNGEKQNQVVCVTGAGGFIGSWVVKELLLRGYRVRGTARDPADRKNGHLLALDGANDRLSLHRADVLDYQSLRAAFAGCQGVFHVASPVSKDSNLVPVAVEGTRNVINAAADVGVRRVVFTSSYGAVHMNPNRSPDAVLDETCWSDPEFCLREDIYCYAKMMAEKTAAEEASKRHMQLAVVVPCVTVGPMLQPGVNFSTHHIVRYLTGAAATYPNAVAAYVDVRDIARAHVLVYERHDARGRYLCIGTVVHRAQLLRMLKELFPNYPVTAKCDDELNPMVKPYKFSSQRIKALGLEFTPLRQSLKEAFVCLQRKGHLPLAVVTQQRASFTDHIHITMSSSIPNIAIDNGDDLQQQQQLVCVTGAGGFIGSWVVRELLLRGNYRVRAAVRDPADRKNAHLLKLDGAGERRLTLCRADVLDYASLLAAFAGCHGVFHVACPLSKHDPELMTVAVEGTRNVVNAAADMGVRRVVFTSSYGAVHMNPNRSPDAVLDENCWSDLEFCRQKDLYCYAKTMAEMTASEEATKRGLDLAVVVPSMTMGPMLQPTLNLSSTHVANYLTGAKKSYPNAVAAYVDVRDVAHAHVLVYERHDTRGRYLCIGEVVHRARLLQILRELFPQYPVTAKCEDKGKVMVKPYEFSSKRLRDLGLEFTPLRKSLYEAVICMQQNGHLSAVVPS